MTEALGWLEKQQLALDGWGSSIWPRTNHDRLEGRQGRRDDKTVGHAYPYYEVHKYCIFSALKDQKRQAGAAGLVTQQHDGSHVCF